MWFVTEDIALGQGQDDAEKQRKGRPNPSKWRQVEEWGPEAKLVTEDVAKMFIAKKKKEFTSSQPAILSLIRLTFTACSVLAGSSARSWERGFFFCPPSRNSESTWRNVILSSKVF